MLARARRLALSAARTAARRALSSRAPMASASPARGAKRARAAASAGAPRFSSRFDSGNGQLVSASATEMRVRIDQDPYTEVDGRSHMMWFHFKVSNLPLEPLDVVIENAGECSYVEGWANYRAVHSTDRLNWERLGATSYDEASGELRMTIDRNNDLAGASFVWLAYFAPYSYEDYMTFVGACAQSDRCSVETIGATLDGADMEVLTVRAAGSDASEDASKRSIWLIARQHPGESQASWWMEGCLARLLDEADPLSAKLLEGATFRVVANMNPDGSRRGHLRTNAAGANLNREWAKPSEVYSPEVFHVLREMQQSGLDFCLDVHGDEALPYNFIAGAEGIPSWTTRLASLQKEFCIAYERANPDFQLVEGYDVDAPGEANMLVCSNALTERFDAPALTLEMPFKDNANAPDETVGWSPDRCRRLGHSALDALAVVLPTLR